VIVLRVSAAGRTVDFRSDQAEVTLGADRAADVSLPKADWPPRAATFRQAGVEVLVRIPGRPQELSLRVGDEIRLGGVDVALVGLLPREPAPIAAFGDYVERETPTGNGDGGFELDVRPAAAPIPPPPAKTPPAPPAPALASAPAPAAARASAGPTAAAAPAPPPPPSETKPRWLTESHDFGNELYATFKRSPFWALSAAIHVLIFLVFTFFATPPPAKPERSRGTIEASLTNARASDSDAASRLDGLEPAPLPEIPVVDAEDFGKPLEADRPDSPIPDRLDALPEPVPHALEIGVMPTFSAAGSRTKTRPPLVPRTDAKELKTPFTEKDAGDANAKASEAARAALGRGGRGRSLDGISKDDLIVVDGAFDHMERVLDGLTIPHQLLTPYDPALTKPQTYAGVKFLFWNCGEPLAARRIAQVAPRIQAFVKNGGYLFTSDWGVSNVLQHAFPGYLDTQGRDAPLPEMVIEVEPGKGAQDHPLLEGVFVPGVRGKWWLEQQSFDLLVKRRSDVTVLIESPELKESLGRSPAVAVTFTYGRGRVLHILGHYFQEAGNLAGTMAAHRLALNFVLMRLEQDK
jgi:hypothetical protein